MDPFANIKAFDCESVPAVADVSEDIDQPFDDVPSFDPSTSPEVDVTAGLASDKALINSPRRRLFVDYRSNPAAFKHLEDLPGQWETLHGVISGKYALWDMVPAIIERTGQNIAHLTLATLSFSKANAADLLGLIDGGQIGRVSLLVSYYFKSTNAEIYDSLVPELRSRGHKCLAMRTHCKIILAAMTDGTRYTVESSANLRSCKNVEQFALTNDAALYDFHHGWIEGELMAGVEVDTMADNKPKPPASITGEALAEWHRVTEEISGTITREDRAVLIVYVQTWAANQEAAAHVAKHGTVVKWSNGNPGPNPYYKIQNETGKALRGLLADLKLTPASRPPEKKDDDEEELEV